MKILKFLALPFLLAACSSNPQTYQAETPKMDFIGYFTGTTYGYGAIYGFTGKMTDHFTITIKGTPGKTAAGQRTMHMAESFTHASGKRQQRAWDIVEPTPNTIRATAPDVPGIATGQQSGNAAALNYKITIQRDNGQSVTLGASDWLWQITPDIVLNRNQLSKFGIPVAELVISFTKQPPVGK